jgi:membrane protein YdbS with pleckstrin-like domain
MLKQFMLADEKIIRSEKPSILGQKEFWRGIGLIILSIVIFAALSLFLPKYDISFSALFSYVGIKNLPLIGSLPVISTLLEIIGILYILVSELQVYFIEYIITNSRVMIERGIIAKNTNIILPSKISDVSVDISILDRILKLGKVVIRPEEQGRPNIVLRGIRDPYSFQGAVLKLIGNVTYKNPNGN